MDKAENNAGPNPRLTDYLERAAKENPGADSKFTEENRAKHMAQYEMRNGKEVCINAVHTRIAADSVSFGTQTRMQVTGPVFDSKITALVDTGSERTIISESELRRLKLYSRMREGPFYPLIVANDQVIFAAGNVNLPVKLVDSANGHTYTREINFLVLKETNVPIIFGLDTLKVFFADIKLQTNSLQFLPRLSPDGVVSAAPLDPTVESFITVDRTTFVRASSFQAVRVKYDAELSRDPQQRPILIEPSTAYNRRGVAINIRFPPHVHTGQREVPGEYLLLLENTSTHSLTLHAGTRIGVASLTNSRAARVVNSVQQYGEYIEADAAQEDAETAEQSATRARLERHARAIEEMRQCGLMDVEIAHILLHPRANSGPSLNFDGSLVDVGASWTDNYGLVTHTLPSGQIIQEPAATRPNYTWQVEHQLRANAKRAGMTQAEEDDFIEGEGPMAHAHRQ